MKFSFILLLLIGLTSCSRKSPQELLHEGNEAYENKMVDQALDCYLQIVDRAPESPYADTAQYRAASIYSNELHNPRKALEAYRKYYQLFPKSLQAPTALFLTGFLYNNELHNIDSARITYQEFLDKFPNHSLAQSARFEVETLGKDPSHIFPSHPQDEHTEADAKKNAK